MNEEQKAAYIVAASVRALITAMGMAAANQHRQIIGESPCYTENDFLCLIENSGIGENQILSLIQG